MAEDTALEMRADPTGGLVHQPTPPPSSRPGVTKEALLSARDGWHEERCRHRFLLDAYAGTGGFQGRVRQPFRDYWGWAADVYSDAVLDAQSGLSDSGVQTYLDRFTREETDKFARRAGLAHYPNYIASFVDVPLSYMFRKPFMTQPDTDELGALGVWMQDADGAGSSWQDMMRDTIVPRAAVLGWCPVLFDLPNSGSRQSTAFEASRSKVAPYAVPLFPSNLLDWSHDTNGVLRWAKVRTDYVERDHPLEPGRDITRITMWYRDSWEWYELTSSARDREPYVSAFAEGAHPFGRVPIVVARRKPIPDDAFRGLPIASSASDEARRIFNYLSELDEHLRLCAYAFLEFPTEDPNAPGSKLLGNGQGLPVAPDWGNTHKWVSPDPGVATIYEARIATAIEEMYRLQKMEFTRGTKGGSQRSGLSQAFEFEATNRAIAEIARMTARFDQEVRRMISAVVKGPEVEKIRVVAPTRFDVEEMATELEEATMAISLGLGPTAEAEIKKKVVRAQLPHLSDEKWEAIEQEIDEVSEEVGAEERDERAGRRGQSAGIETDEENDDEDETEEV